MALDYFTTLVSSVDAERFLSSGRLMINCIQHQMSSGIFQSQMAIGSWFCTPLLPHLSTLNGWPGSTHQKPCPSKHPITWWLCTRNVPDPTGPDCSASTWDHSTSTSERHTERSGVLADNGESRSVPEIFGAPWRWETIIDGLPFIAIGYHQFRFCDSFEFEGMLFIDRCFVLFSPWGNLIIPLLRAAAISSTIATVIASSNTVRDEYQSWPPDPFNPSSPSPTSVRPDRPRIIAPAYKWEVLPSIIQTNPYLHKWNNTIFGDAQKYYDQPVKSYFVDGGNGVLDIAREIKMRVKAWAYVYRITKDTKWVDRTWIELQNAAGNGTSPFGDPGNNWYTAHFLDVAEFTSAFAIGYDWMYDAWNPHQRDSIMWSIINLAVIGDDPTGTAETMLSLTVPNSKKNCVLAPSSDGTWSETPNYWYFGTTAHSEMSSALLTATGNTYDLVDPKFAMTALYHMHVSAPTGQFDYGDTGPNKFSTTANSMMFYGSYFKEPRYLLFQRDRVDVGEPWSMFWYDPSVRGAFWNDMPFDHYFDDDLDQWAAMRSNWPTTHGDLDAGTFVLDAMGQRWAGELGNGDYLSEGYFSSEGQDSHRWLYYRKRTEGQNTLVVNNDNQNVWAQPTVKYDSTGDRQGLDYDYIPGTNSTAFFVTDLTGTYNGQRIKRGVRLINGRKQVLLQDDLLDVTQSVEWRMHTNATIAIENGGQTAMLTLGGQTMQVQLLNPGAGVGFSIKDAVRAPTDPALPPNQADQPNPGVKVLCVSLAPGKTQSLQVLFSPQWPGMSVSDLRLPPHVHLDDWSLTSHN
ncbi:Heparinase II III family protein [Rhizoctonia solani]|uniref:Heparinase II III family protein n=1 Tax=Rhizoctonia solani TaxID=456999 RepID=A0A8H7I5T3_9AGAM|nr:Heparinase II III family protein [Rhizoctonia solani]